MFLAHQDLLDHAVSLALPVITELTVFLATQALEEAKDHLVDLEVPVYLDPKDLLETKETKETVDQLVISDN